MRLSFSFVVLTIILSSCGGSGGSGGSDFIPQIKTSTPIFLKKDYPECPRIYAQSTNTELKIIKFLNGRSAVENIDFIELFTGNKLVDRNNIVITETLADYNSSTLYKARWSEAKGEYDLDYDHWNEEGNTQTKGEQFEVCKGAGSFTQNSLENAALNITSTIDETRKAIVSVAPELKIPPVMIKVLPSITEQEIYVNGPKASNEESNNDGDKVFETKKQYYTDNATWNREGQVDTITFYPQSEEFIKITGLKTPFWEIPMVGAHEFGHHLFDKIFPQLTPVISEVKKNISSCFHNEMQNKLMQKSVQNKMKDSEGRTSGGSYAYSSLHEGIGDLISFYALSEGEGSLTGINCMKKSRDVNSEVFGDGTEKVMNYSVVSIMNSKSFLAPTSKDCNVPYFQDNHAIGAIFAHNFDKIISKFTSDRMKKLQILIKWGQESSKHQDKLNEMTSSRYIAEVTKILFKTIYKNIGNPSQYEDCIQIKSMYYELDNDFGSTTHMYCR